jgi:hypothetical protein
VDTIEDCCVAKKMEKGGGNRKVGAHRFNFKIKGSLSRDSRT